MAAAASGGASSGGANDDAGPGWCCERRPWVSWVGRAGLAAALGELGGTRGDGLLGRAASVVSDTNS